MTIEEARKTADAFNESVAYAVSYMHMGDFCDKMNALTPTFLWSIDEDIYGVKVSG